MVAYRKYDDPLVEDVAALNAKYQERRSEIGKARFLVAQAGDPALHYQHSHMGYSYRLSNLLAAMGRGQLCVPDERADVRRANNAFYRKLLRHLPGLSFMPEAPGRRSTFWLTCIQIDPEVFGATREDLRLALEAANIESRPVWKPMHLQPVFAQHPVVGGRVAEQLFENGLCLPSGSSLTDEDSERVVDVILRVADRDLLPCLQ